MRARIASSLLAAASLIGCGADSAPAEPEPDFPPVRGSSALFSLLAYQDVRADETPEGHPVVNDRMRPQPNGRDEFGNLRALIVTPPTTMRFQVPETHPEAVLEYALAIQRTHYRKEGEVHVVGTLDGEPLFEHRLDCSGLLPMEARRWYFHEVALGAGPAGGELVVSFHYQGTRKRAPEVGIAKLRVAVPFVAARTRASPGRPNVVLVVVDTLRADALRCYGNPRGVSPVMDSIAARGTRYDRAFAASSWTGPSTASLLTGRSVPEHGLGVGAFFLADAFDTLPEIFQRAGFTTAGFVCNPLIANSRNFDQGFEFFESYVWSTSNEIANGVRAWLQKNHEQRFFLYLHYTDPHDPYVPLEASERRFVGAPAPEDLIAGEDMDDAMVGFYRGHGGDRAQLVASTDHNRELYHAEVFDVDASIGRVLEQLERLGLTDSTVVCVTSDHGEEFLEHGWFGHNAQLFDETVRIPLLLAGPGLPGGEVVSTPVENRHVAATLLALAGVEVPEALEPVDLTDETDLAEQAAHGVFLATGWGEWADFETGANVRLGQFQSVVDGKWRLVWCPQADMPGEPFAALFDLDADPGCARDVSAAHPEVTERLVARVQQWYEAGLARQPRMMPVAEETLELLRGLGYLDAGDGD